LFHNQRLSYELALEVAGALSRTLVLPGFFKFPHPHPYDGDDWVPVRDLFDWDTLTRCNNNIIELDDLLHRCGADVLDNHITVPFAPMWMRSKAKAPWINQTRPDMRWKSKDMEGTMIFSSREIRPIVPLSFTDLFWRLLRPFLQEGVANAKAVRVHGLIASNGSIASPVCFVPGREVQRSAQQILDRMRSENDNTLALGVHLRLFKHSTKTSGGYLQPELADRQQSVCNVEPSIFMQLIVEVMDYTFGGLWPSHTYVASNEDNETLLMQYVHGMPGLRKNPYSVDQYLSAVSIEESTVALQSVLLDTLLLAMTHYFIGNICSTMSQYVFLLRQHFGRPFNSTFLLGGDQHADVLRYLRVRDS